MTNLQEGVEVIIDVLDYRMNLDFDYDPNGPLVFYETAQTIINQQALRIAELEAQLAAEYRRANELEAQLERVSTGKEQPA